MLKKTGFIFLTLMFFVFLSVSTTLAKNDKAKHQKNAPPKSEKALEQQDDDFPKLERTEKREGPKGPKGGPSGPNGRSFMGKLYFFEEDPAPEDLIVEEEPGDGEVTEPGDDPDAEDFIDEENCILDIAWGKMNYNLVGPYFKFVFNGHGLEVLTEYTLIYYPEPSGERLLCLGRAVSDEFGNVHMNERLYDLCDLPIPEDANDGAQLILVLSDDVDCDNALTTRWNPGLYLFGFNLMKFDDTDCEYETTTLEEEPEEEPEETI